MTVLHVILIVVLIFVAIGLLGWGLQLFSGIFSFLWDGFIGCFEIVWSFIGYIVLAIFLGALLMALF